MKAISTIIRKHITTALLTCVICLVVPGLVLAGEGSALDLNTASAKQLESLPGIGKETAKRIVEYREAQGPFKSVDDLQHVKGIGKAKLAKIQDKLTVGISAKSPESH